MENPTQPPPTTNHSTQKDKTPLFKKLALFAKLGPPLPQRRRHRTTSAEAEQALAAKARMSADDYRAWRESESRSSSRYSSRRGSAEESGAPDAGRRERADVERNDSVREGPREKPDPAGPRGGEEEEGEGRGERPGWDRRAGDHERERRRSQQEGERQHRQEEQLAGRKSSVGGERPSGDAGEIKLNEKGRYRSHGKEKKERGRLVKKFFRHGDDKAAMETVNGTN
ncbi:hypothetical protein BKCO1_3400049 [Neofusicoccum parvum]|uniref:Uncharacterized protein n=1 Tax=Neofusicoccum parvum TaxID=310453 RepID=A0ACB5SB68_9PEZI|nr:hypothetical protein BKCO1_3400049 [Neofusicoccum parvum]